MNTVVTLLSGSFLGQLSGNPAGLTVDTVKVQSVWDFLVKGGPMMIPIALCSLIALTIIVERTISLRRRHIIRGDLVMKVTGCMENKRDDHSSAVEHCRADGSPTAIILLAAIRKLDEPLEVLERHIQDAGERVVLGLRKNLRALSVIASIAPLLGLLGTIFGMIHAFQTVATSGEALGRTELLAKGIYQAMITTAAGLLVAIPVLVAYHWLTARVERMVHELDGMIVGFVEQWGTTSTARASMSANLGTAHQNEIQPDESDQMVCAITA